MFIEITFLNSFYGDILSFKCENQTDMSNLLYTDKVDVYYSLLYFVRVDMSYIMLYVDQVNMWYNKLFTIPIVIS